MLSKKYCLITTLMITSILLAGCHKPAGLTKTITTKQTILPAGGSNLDLNHALTAADHALFAAVYTKAAFTPEEGTFRLNATADPATQADWQNRLAQFATPNPNFSLANVQRALAQGANPNAVCDGLTPLIYAASACHPEAAAVVQCLIAAGADVNAQPSFWASPLTNAIQLLDTGLISASKDTGCPKPNPFPAIIKSLLQAGADPNMGNGMAAALMLLVNRANPQTPELVGLLLAAGADPNANNGEGSALIRTARSTSPHAFAIVDLLTKAGAKVPVSELIKAKDRKAAAAFWRDRDAIEQALHSPNPAATEIARLLQAAVLDQCCAQDPEYFSQLAQAELQREYTHPTAERSRKKY